MLGSINCPNLNFKLKLLLAVIYKAPVNLVSGLLMLGLNPGNCLRAFESLSLTFLSALKIIQVGSVQKTESIIKIPLIGQEAKCKAQQTNFFIFPRPK